MSEAQIEGADAAPTKKKPGRPPKTPVEEIPDGCDACYVAIPNKVSRGDGVKKAKPGERIIGPSEAIDALELREIAFRDKVEAQSAFKSFKRKEEARLAKEANAEAIRQANRERIKQERLAAAELEWAE